MTQKYLKRITGFLRRDYNIKADIKDLPGYQDMNYLVSSLSGERFILKITPDAGNLDFIRSQNRILVGLSHREYGRAIPFPIENINGELVSEVQWEGKTGFARLFHFIEGDFLAEQKPDLAFFKDLGRIFGQMDRDMEGLEDPVLKSRTHEWDLARVMEVADDVHLISNPADRRLVHYFLMKYREEVLPVYHRLPKGLIHGDGNDYNILISRDQGSGSRGQGSGVREQGSGSRGQGAEGRSQVCGILDFGDMVWSARVHEVAIVLAYAMMGREGFPDVFHQVVNGYQSVVRLSVGELSVIYYLIAARWCQTMVMAARQEKVNPGSSYHQVSVEGARKMLHRWLKINPVCLIEKGGKNGKSEFREEGEDAKDVAGERCTVLDPDVERRYRYFSRAVSLSYPEPIQMVGAAMQYMYSAGGKTYVDCVNNIPHVGHCHPKVVEAGQRQMARLNTNTRYLYRSLDLYAEKLLEKFPPSLNRVFFVNSGSAATDLAVRLIKAHTGRNGFFVLDHAYHGNTQSAISLSPYKFNRKGGTGKPENIHIVPLTDVRSSSLNPGAERRREMWPAPAALFAEPIPGCAGQVMLDRAYMQEIYREVRTLGGLCVSDEVQTGFGRVGHTYWGYELHDVVPDIVLLGKPMANGHPMGAVVCTGEIARSFETGMEFFSSFGGNPVSCEIARAVMEVIEEEGLQEHARQVGDFLLDELRALAGTLPAISDVRGSGLFLGIEFVRDHGTMEPDGAKAKSIVNRMKERGFLLSTDGPFNNVIKFKPPMCFSMENAEELVENIRIPD